MAWTMTTFEMCIRDRYSEGVADVYFGGYPERGGGAEEAVNGWAFLRTVLRGLGQWKIQGILKIKRG